MRTELLLTRRRVFAATGLGLAVAVLAAGLLSRQSQAEALREGVAARSAPVVKLVVPTAVAGEALELPARLEAWTRAPIQARVSGYLKRWTVDIGGSVKAGQLLGEIEAPELEQQLAQARAELATARSNAALAATTAERWQSLLDINFVSRQGADEKAGDLAAKQSVGDALQANVQRMQAMTQYTRLVAPFDGVVTARNTDTGALISAGNSIGNELFVVSDVRRLRVYVDVPQRQVASIRVGGKARLVVPERPTQHYSATVQSLAGAIEAGSGAMRVQLAVDNEAGELLPGGFARLRFEASAAQDAEPGAVGVPPSALIFGKDGVSVATLQAGDRVLLKRVTIGRDRGHVVELAGGLERDDRVIDSPPDGIVSGEQVRIADAAPKTAS